MPVNLLYTIKVSTSNPGVCTSHPVVLLSNRITFLNPEEELPPVDSKRVSVNPVGKLLQSPTQGEDGEEPPVIQLDIIMLSPCQGQL